jgi:hypothetical protein
VSKPRQKAPAPVFEVIFKGPGIYPEKITVPFLARTLSAVRRLASGFEPADDDDEVNSPEEGPLGLVKVKRSASAVYQFAAGSPKSALARFSETGRVILNPDDIGDNDYILNPLAELSNIAKSLECTIQLRSVDGRNGVLATIGRESYHTVAKNLLITSDTSITGTVERAGGSTGKKCSLRLPKRTRILYCDVASVDLVRKLGEMLYQEVAVSGTATWVKTNWKIASFVVKSVWQPQIGSASEAREAIRNAGAKSWDNIDDPETFFKETSGS